MLGKRPAEGPSQAKLSGIRAANQVARLLPTRHDLLAVGLGVVIRSLGRDGQTTDAAVRQRRSVACTCRDGEKL